MVISPFPSSPPVRAFLTIADSVQHFHRSISFYARPFSSILLTHALALSAAIFYARKSPHEHEFELWEFCNSDGCNRTEIHLLLHRGRRHQQTCTESSLYSAVGVAVFGLTNVSDLLIG